MASYFKAADLPDWLFDLIVAMAALMTILGWSYLYMRAHGRTVLDAGLDRRAADSPLYVLFMNRLYADELYQLLGSTDHATGPSTRQAGPGWSR